MLRLNFAIKPLRCACEVLKNSTKLPPSGLYHSALRLKTLRSLHTVKFTPRNVCQEHLRPNFNTALKRERIFLVPQRLSSRLSRTPKKTSNIDVVLYVSSGIIFMVGVSYASVPLYRMFCQVTGIGGDPNISRKTEDVSTMKPVRERPITVLFNADKHAAMRWNFKPSQHKVNVVPGETALAFYTAKNPTDEPIVGVATYNVIPFQAGPYFNKIQCFCFEEQWLNPHEEVDMPVFFYLDPEFDNDPQLSAVNEIVLSYTFFKAEEGQTLPVPGFMNTRFKGTQAQGA